MDSKERRGHIIGAEELFYKKWRGIQISGYVGRSLLVSLRGSVLNWTLRPCQNVG